MSITYSWANEEFSSIVRGVKNKKRKEIKLVNLLSLEWLLNNHTAFIEDHINDRIVDLWQPFKHSMLYSYKQKSSASIKDVLPAFTDMSYKGMDIANGSKAMNRYLAFMKGQLSEEEEQFMFDALDKYCYQDTLAMVKLIDVLYEKLVVSNCNTTA